MNGNRRSPGTWLAAFVVISVAVAGYFIGLQAPMPDRSDDGDNPVHEGGVAAGHTHPAPSASPDVIPATSWSEMPAVIRNRLASHKSSLSQLRAEAEPFREFTITEGEKQFALQLRSLNRAFNGAPPTVPHPIDQMSSSACMACHGEGFRTPSLRASRMSHEFLPNCTQCHVEHNPEHWPAAEFRESMFTGLPAPSGGPRAYPGAPPQIPHTTWMRTDCLSCHGYNGLQGIRTTHPWRHNCQQCHAPAATMEQSGLEAEPQFLKPIRVNPGTPGMPEQSP